METTVSTILGEVPRFEMGQRPRNGSRVLAGDRSELSGVFGSNRRGSIGIGELGHLQVVRRRPHGPQVISGHPIECVEGGLGLAAPILAEPTEQGGRGQYRKQRTQCQTQVLADPLRCALGD